MKNLIKKYKLISHPEGGYFRENYRSDQIVKSGAAEKERNALTHIYFLLTKGQVSRFHKILHDEIWNFHEGDPIRIVKFDGDRLKEETIGQNCNSYVSTVKGGVFQAAESTGEYTLSSCVVAPGFDFKDFCFLCEHGETFKKFKNMYPAYKRFL